MTMVERPPADAETCGGGGPVAAGHPKGLDYGLAFDHGERSPRLGTAGRFGRGRIDTRPGDGAHELTARAIECLLDLIVILMRNTVADGDANCDGVVDFADPLLVRAAWARARERRRLGLRPR